MKLKLYYYLFTQVGLTVCLFAHSSGRLTVCESALCRSLDDK